MNMCNAAQSLCTVLSESYDGAGAEDLFKEGAVHVIPTLHHRSFPSTVHLLAGPKFTDAIRRRGYIISSAPSPTEGAAGYTVVL